MKSKRILVAASFAMIASPALADGDSESGKATFEENCANCHYEDDFVDEADSVLKATLLAILNGEIRHRGGFRGLTEQDVADLAAFLEQQ